MIDEFIVILGQLEEVTFKNVTMTAEFRTLSFQFCTNVRRLVIKGIHDDIVIGADNSWLCRRYSRLDTVHFDDIDDVNGVTTRIGNIEGLTTFFNLNPNVRNFTTSYDFLVENLEALLASHAQLTVLKIQTPLQPHRIDGEIRNALRRLYDNGFYQRLRLCNVEIRRQRDLDKIATIRSIEALYIEEMQICAITIPPLMGNSLKEIGWLDVSAINSPNRTAKSLQAERMYIHVTSIKEMLPFVRFASNLQSIYVKHFEEDDEVTVVDVVKLNKQRAQLDGVRKMTIYVNEDIYLATKHASLPTSCSLVELQPTTVFMLDNEEFY